MAIGSWSVNPAWQNFSSLYRESRSAIEAPTDMERSHHLTAALYFGIATLEAFLNREMRNYLRQSKSDDEIYETLRKGRFSEKLDKWPSQIIGESPRFPETSIDLIKLCNEVRGDLTHPKTLGHDIYERLLKVEPDSIVNAVATYIVVYHSTQGTRYPYWLFGWNYLNPSKDTHETILLNDQQFSHSLAALGFNVPASSWGESEAWRDQYLKSLNGFQEIKKALESTTGCEPKYAQFPFQPKLCRRWWTTEHQRSCGNVSEQALAHARFIDET